VTVVQHRHTEQLLDAGQALLSGQPHLQTLEPVQLLLPSLLPLQSPSAPAAAGQRGQTGPGRVRASSLASYKGYSGTGEGMRILSSNARRTTQPGLCLYNLVLQIRA
jgi:hypothetical protein